MFSSLLTPEDRAALRQPRGYRSPFSLPTKSPEATNRAVLMLVLECLESRPLHILDLGCGSGALLQCVAEHYRAQGWDPQEYLLGIDSDENFFQAQVPFQVGELTKPLNQQIRPFDLIIAVQVLEHVRSPYLLLDEIYKTLNSNGKFLFSVPNMMTISSRLRFLFTGRFEHYPGPSSDPVDSPSGFGHINPLPVQYWDYGLRYSGFTDIHYQTDRIKRGSLFLATLFSPFLWLGKRLLHRRGRRSNERIYRQNLRPFREINSIRNLAGRGLIVICRKPGNG